jgi:hypothetical protein
VAYKEVLHIGANKSASTTLQRRLFPKVDGLIYLGEDCENYGSSRELLNHMIYEDDFNYSSEKVNTLFERYKSLARQKNETFLYSNEDIMTSRVPSQVLLRLKALMPHATIVLIIRNQFDAIPSWYANHGAYLKGVPRHFWRRYVSADEFMNHFTNFFNYGPFDCFMYNKVLSKYADAFGKENIKVLFFEDFVKQKEKFIKDLSEILGIDPTLALELVREGAERKRVTQRRFNFHKLSRYIPVDKLLEKAPAKMKKSIENFLDSGSKATELGMSQWHDKIAEIFREDNKALERNYNLDLKKYGYPL